MFPGCACVLVLLFGLAAPALGWPPRPVALDPPPPPGDLVEERGFVESSGAWIHFRLIRLTASDPAPRALFIHFHGGPGGTSVVFREAIGRRLVETTGDLLLIDQRGCGYSSYAGVSPASFTLAQSVEDMHAVISHVLSRENHPWRCGKIAIGHSFGAALAIQCHLRYPDLFHRLVLVAPALDHRDVRRFSYRAVRREAEARQDTKKLAELERLEKAHPMGSAEEGLLFLGAVSGEQYDHHARRFSRQEEEDLHRLLRLRSPEPDRPLEVGSLHRKNGTLDSLRLDQELENLTVPVLIVGGRDDHLTPAESLEIAHKLIPGSTLEMVPGAGHHPYLLEPERFMGILGGFLHGTPDP